MKFIFDKTMPISKMTLRPFFAILICAGLYGCFSEPEYSLEPEIEFVQILNVPIPGNTDSVHIKVSFQDGDGDLGLGPQDQYPDYGEYMTDDHGDIISDSIPNKFHFNYFITVYRKEGEDFKLVEFPQFQTYNGRFPVLNDIGIQTPLEGELNYSFRMEIGILGSPIRQGDILKFEVQIADRAKNLSNIVETSQIIAGVGPVIPE